MKDYVGAFDGANIIGLTGSREQVNAAQAAFRVSARRRDTADGDYTMSHTSTATRTGPDGRFVMVSPSRRVADHLAELVR